MIDVITQWMNAILGWATQMPQHGWALLLSVVISSLFVQFLKSTLGAWWVNVTDVSKKQHAAVVRLFAFVIGFVICYTLWPEPIYKVWTSVFAALVAPILYKLTMNLVYKKWPDAEKWFSGYLD